MTHCFQALESAPGRHAPIPPNAKRCEFRDLVHAHLHQLLNRPAKNFARFATLREPGKSRGTCLIHVGGPLRCLDGLFVDQAAAEPT
jgi:hypothetical protein